MNSTVTLCLPYAAVNFVETERARAILPAFKQVPRGAKSRQSGMIMLPLLGDDGGLSVGTIKRRATVIGFDDRKERINERKQQQQRAL